MEEELLEQPNISPGERVKPWQFKKGQSGNPAGRPPGKSLKERAKAMLNAMTEEEEQEFLEGIDKRIIWEMAEGKPDSKNENTGQLQVLLIDKELAEIYGIRTTPKTEGSGQEPSKV